MRNLDQIRASHALDKAEESYFQGAHGGKVVQKIPPYIRTNGFLATLAFALEEDKNGKKKREGYQNVFDAIASHLASEHIALCQGKNAEALQQELVEADSVLLRRVTEEAMAYLGYLRRFVRQEED